MKATTSLTEIFVNPETKIMMIRIGIMNLTRIRNGINHMNLTFPYEVNSDHN